MGQGHYVYLIILSVHNVWYYQSNKNLLCYYIKRVLCVKWCNVCFYMSTVHI